MSLPGEAKKEVERFLLKGQKIAAIKHLKDTYHLSLQESTILVEALDEKRTIDQETAPASSASLLDDASRRKVQTLVESGKKIQAVKLTKESLGISFQKAMELVEDLERQFNPHGYSYRAQASRGGATNIVAGVFTGLGLIFIGVAALIYFRQNQSIRQSDLVKGNVVRMKTNHDGMSAPIIEYEWNGKKWFYASNTYSSPPAYSVNEKVPIYVNRQDPDDIILDTFTGRFLLIGILGAFGFFFTGIPLLIIYFTARRPHKPKTHNLYDGGS